MRIFIATLLVIFLSLPAFSAKYAGDPFSLGAGARQLAMGRAVIAGPFDGSAGYWNPAGLNLLTDRQVSAMHSETFGSLLNHDYLSYTVNKGMTNSRFIAYGFYFYYLGGGGIKITQPDEVTNRYVVIREESHADIMLAGSLSGKLNDKIDIGATVKIIYRDVVDVKGYGLSADIGALYQPYDFARIGLVISDLTSGIIRYSNGNSESIVPTVKPGILLMHTIKDFTGRLAMAGDIKFEGIKYGAEYWLGDISLDTHFGFEIGWRETLFGRIGSDIGNFTAGFGINLKNANINLAYLHNSDFDETFRISAGYIFK